jgi:hypothetical protein
MVTHTTVTRKDLQLTYSLALIRVSVINLLKELRVL